MKIEDLYKHLSAKQLRRLVMYKDGVSVAQIARKEGVCINSVKESIYWATKKMAKKRKDTLTGDI